MTKAFDQLLGQALAFQYPDHPEFDGEVRLPDLGKVFKELRRAMHASNGRIEVDGPLRPLMRQIAQPLKLGEMHERHFIFKEAWPQHLSRELARGQSGTGGDVTVQALREAMDKPKPKGLANAVQNLLIMVFAEHGQYAFTLHGGPFDDVTLKEIRDGLVLIKQELAEPDQWKKALDHAGALFGLTINPLRTANNQNELQKQVLDAAASHVEACRTLGSDLTRQLDALSLSHDCNRVNNAKLAVQLLDTLQSKEGRELVDALADVDAVTSLPALAKSIVSAGRVSNAIADNNWALLEKVWGIPPGPPFSKGGTEWLCDDSAGARIKRSVADALAADELVTALAAALKQAQADATDIITKLPDPEPPKPDPDPKPKPDPKPVPKGKKVLKQDSRRGLSAREAKRVLAEIQLGLSDDVTVDIEYTIVGEADD